MRTMHFSFLIMLFAFVSTFQTNARDIEVSGKITTFDKYPLKDVVVAVKGSQDLIRSGEDGSFSIVCDEKDKLLFTANGFSSKKLAVTKIDGEIPIEVNLKLRNGEKNYELATVYGHIKAETLSHAIDLVEAKLDYSSYAKITDILTEKGNRVNVSPSGIWIEGMSGTPTFIVDGSEVHLSYFESIPTTDIESIAILKHTASARYGMKGYGGVIEVVTKSN